MKQFFRTIKCGLLGAFLLLGFVAPLTFTSCENSHPEINISMEEDYSGIITAINQTNTALADKLANIESAIEAGTLKNAEALEAIKAAVASMEGTVAEKLAAIQAAVNDQTTSFETKMALIETALNDGFADVAEGQDLMKQALESLEGTIEDKLAAVEEAINDQTLSLETKLDLINATVEEGFASIKEGQDLIVAALEAIDGTLQDKMDALEKAIKAQTTTLAAKLAAIETAVKEGFADEVKALGLIKDAVKAVDGTLKSKLDALKQAVDDQTLALETKLAAIEAAVEEGFASEVEALGFIKDAIDALEGTVEEKLAAIEEAIKDQTLELKTKLQLIRVALEKGLTDANTTLGQIEEAIKAQNDSIGEIKGLLGEIVESVKGISEALSEDGAIDKDLKAIADSIGALRPDLAAIAATLINKDGVNIADLITTISDALAKDDEGKTVLDDMAELLEDLLEAITGKDPDDPHRGKINGFEYIEMGDGLKWAIQNIGAADSTQIGQFFAWGEIAPKTSFTWDTYKFMEAGKGEPKFITKYQQPDEYYDGIWYEGPGHRFVGDNKSILDKEDDVASALWGGTWRMPTEAEFAALGDRTKFTWERAFLSDGTQYGFKVTSKIPGYEGNSIVLIIGGYMTEEGLQADYTTSYYWTTNAITSNPTQDPQTATRLASAYMVSMGPGAFFSKINRYWGVSIRPVSY